MPFDGFPDRLGHPLEGLGWHADGSGIGAGIGSADLSETVWLRPTPDLPALLLREAPGDFRPVTLGAESDPYAPTERGLALTRQVLEALDHAGRPVTIVTRSALVLRDRDILLRLARRGLVRVCIAMATLDAALARRLEPRAAPPALRLLTIRTLAEAGIPVGLLTAPMIAGLNDLELERILAAGAAAGATEAGLVPVHLPAEARPNIEAWVRAQMPHRAAQALALVREARARPSGTLAERFQAAATRLGLNHPPAARRPHSEPTLAAA